MSCSVLLVAHGSSTLSVLRRLLLLSGHDVTYAEDAVAALALASVSSFDCVLLDIGLPDDSGVLLARELSKLRLGGVALSGNAEPEYAAACRAAGFVHVLKPIGYSTLLGAIDAMLMSQERHSGS